VPEIKPAAMINRPLIIFMVTIMLSLGGLLSIFLLPIQILPKLASPYVNVFITLERETDLDTIEKEVVFPLESVVSNAQYVDQVNVNTGTRNVRMISF